MLKGPLNVSETSAVCRLLFLRPLQQNLVNFSLNKNSKKYIQQKKNLAKNHGYLLLFALLDFIQSCFVNLSNIDFQYDGRKKTKTERKKSHQQGKQRTLSED